MFPRHASQVPDGDHRRLGERRSRFVTLMSWWCIVLAAGLCSLGLVPEPSELPLDPQAGVLASRVMGGLLLLAVAVLAGAVGLLLRQEWARRLFILLLGLVMAGALAGLWLQHLLLQSLWMSMADGRASPPPLRELASLTTLSQWIAAGVTLLVCVGLGWIIMQLRSPLVREEFGG